jgi:hypothetical protein
VSQNFAQNCFPPRKRTLNRNASRTSSCQRLWRVSFSPRAIKRAIAKMQLRCAKCSRSLPISSRKRNLALSSRELLNRSCDWQNKQAARLHPTPSFRFSRRTTNFSPDHVSSIAHTFTSTNPRGSATARITSSVTSVGAPADFLGQEIQTVPVSETLSRRTGNLFANSLHFLTNRWTKVESGFKRSEKVTPSGIESSNRR